MIYVTIIIFIVLIAGTTIYVVLNKWVQSHGLAVLHEYGKWQIDLVGWEALWPTLAVGACAGVVIALLITMLLSDTLYSLVHSHFEDKNAEEKEALSQLRQELNKRQASIDAEIKKNAAEYAASYEATIELLETSRYQLKKENEYLKRKNDIISNRLKGSQQKAKRIKNQHN